MNKATARNIRVQNRYDELMTIGSHGHYETMFRIVREEVELAEAIRDAEIAELVAALDNYIFVFELDPKIAAAIAKVRKP